MRLTRHDARYWGSTGAAPRRASGATLSEVRRGGSVARTSIRMSATLVCLTVAIAACGSDAPTSTTGGEHEPDAGGGASTGDASTDAPTGPNLPPEGGAIDGITLSFERSTPEQIAVYAPITRELPEGAQMTMRYWPAGASDWRIAQPLLRINPAWITSGAPAAPVDAFAGTIFDLVPGTATMVELTLEAPGQAKQTQWTTVTTRALPAPAPASTVKATSASNLQSVLDALKPGDVLELEDGTYEVNQLQLKVSGTEAKPIYIRGASRSGVIVRDKSGIVLQILEISHVVLENFTIEGSGTDSGTSASSVGVSFWNGGASQEYVTLRGLDIRGVDMGIVAGGRLRSVLVYDSDLRGNNTWDKSFVESNKTWNDDAIRIPGEGNCAFQNTVHAFGDAFAVTDGIHSSAVYFYRNRVTMTGDDAFEGDYSTRNIGFYDNYITNSATLLSLDPLWGGPLYCFRNVSVNTVRGPFKLNSTNSGFFVFNNTIVRTNGTTGWGWVQFNNGQLRSWAFRNNLVIFRGTSGQTMAVESGGNSPIDFTHNGWFPDGSFWWTNSGGSYSSLAAARAGLPATTPLFSTSTKRHEADILFPADPFAAALTLGPDHLTEIKAQPVLALDATSPAHHAGVDLANITDGHTGSAPDMGAIIDGRPVPEWGAKRP